MWNGYKVIDADAHMHEPEYLWERYMEPEYRDQVPRVVGMNGINFIYEPDGRLVPHGKGKTGHPASVYEGMKEKYGEAMDEWWSPQIRLEGDGPFWLGHSGDSAHRQQRQLRRRCFAG